MYCQLKLMLIFYVPRTLNQLSEMSWMSDTSELSEYHRPLDCSSLSSFESGTDMMKPGARQGTRAVRSVTVSR